MVKIRRRDLLLITGFLAFAVRVVLPQGEVTTPKEHFGFSIGEAWAMRLGTISLMLGFFAYPAANDLWALGAIIPLVPVGTALLFPSTTALMSRASNPAELGVTMGIAQTYGGIARMVAPVISTFAYQHFGHTMPFYLAGATVALVGILAFTTVSVPRK